MNKEILLKLELLCEKIKGLQQKNFEYQKKISNFEQIINEQKILINQHLKEKEQLKNELNQLSINDAVAGKTNENKEAKAKIERLIKEINICIASLKD